MAESAEDESDTQVYQDHHNADNQSVNTETGIQRINDYSDSAS